MIYGKWSVQAIKNIDIHTQAGEGRPYVITIAAARHKTTPLLFPVYIYDTEDRTLDTKRLVRTTYYSA